MNFIELINFNEELKEDFIKLNSLIYLNKLNEYEIKEASSMMGLENLNLTSMEHIGNTIVEFIVSIYNKIKAFLKYIISFLSKGLFRHEIKMTYTNKKTGEKFSNFHDAYESAKKSIIDEIRNTKVTNFVPLNFLQHRSEFYNSLNDILIDQIKFVMGNIEDVRADSKDAIDLMYHKFNEGKLKIIGVSVNHQNHINMDGPNKIMKDPSNVIEFGKLLDSFNDYVEVEKKIMNISKPLGDSSYSTMKLLTSIERQLPSKNDKSLILPEQKERLDTLSDVLKTIQVYSFNLAVLIKNCAADKEACYKTGMCINETAATCQVQPPFKKVA